MMTKEEIKDKFKKSAIVSVKKPHLGGQQCGITPLPVTVKNEDLSFEITVGYYRSKHKNKELALALYDLFLDEIL